MVQDGGTGRPWTHLPQTHQIHHSILNNSHLNRTKTSWTASSTKREKWQHWARLERQKCSLTKKLTLDTVTHNREGPRRLSAPWRVRGLCSTSGTQPLGPAPDRWGPKHGAYVQGAWGLWGSEIQLVRGSCMDSPGWGLSTKAAVWEVTGLHVKETQLLILKIHWNFLCGRSCWRVPIFALFLYLAKAGRCVQT